MRTSETFLIIHVAKKKKKHIPKKMKNSACLTKKNI